MKVLYDHQIFSSQVYGGISRYFYELMSRFNLDAGVDFELALRYSNNSYLTGADFVAAAPFSPGRRFFGRTTLLNALNSLVSRRSIRSGKFDLLHPTYYNPYYLPLVGNLPTVVTVYDMTHELYPGLFSASDRTIAWKRAVLGSAAGIIAISENTKKDLLRFYPIAEKRITVVHLASSLHGSLQDSVASDLPASYLLFVGQRSGYKNFSFFIKGVAPLLRDNPHLNVVCAGGGVLTPQEMAMIASLGIAGRVRQYAAGDNLLWELYQRAVAFVFPSLYEGFGIPVLEAFSAGCPVLLSNRSSLPEIAGDAAWYFNPEDEKSLVKVISRVLADVAERENLIARGYERGGGFSWGKVALETKAVYETVL